jgi:ATP/maltotriose-dependent transcriptional regulator MalT
MGNKSGERVVLNNIATELSYQGDTEQALQMTAKSLAIARQMGDRRGEAIGLYNMGNICKDQGNNIQALTEYQAAERLFDELSVKEYQCECLGALAQTALLLGEAAQARVYLHRAVALAESLKRSEYLCALSKTGADISLAAGEIGSEAYASRLEPVIESSPLKIRAEMYLAVYKATGERRWAEKARDEILSRPGWNFRKDYREWMEYLNKI